SGISYKSDRRWAMKPKFLRCVEKEFKTEQPESAVYDPRGGATAMQYVNADFQGVTPMKGIVCQGTFAPSNGARGGTNQ
ncbi:MAG TPA: hypothetical protein VGM62_20400, partial [Chthoniobacterales bacterium]